VDALVLPLVFITIILNVSGNPRSWIKLENPILNYLGKISYGVYMFHPIIIFIMAWAYTHYVATPFANNVDAFSLYFVAI